MLDAFFPYRLAVTASAFSRHLTEVYQKRFGLSRDAWRLLYLLAHVEGASSLDLGRKSSLDKVQVSRAAEKLLSMGLIQRSPAPDRRLWLYACTDQGRAVFDQVHRLVNERSEAILSRMAPEDRAALERGLQALAEATREEAGQS